MRNKKAKLIRKWAIQVWKKKSRADKQKWGLFVGQNELGANMIRTHTAFKRFYRHLKRSYTKKLFTIQEKKSFDLV